MFEAEAGTAGSRSPRRTSFAPRSLSAVSHDLRTPISAVKASVTSLLDIEWPPEPARVPARDDRRGDRPAERARRQPARHDRLQTVRSRSGPPPRRSRASRRACCRPPDVGTPTTRSCSTSPSRSLGCSPTPPSRARARQRHRQRHPLLPGRSARTAQRRRAGGVVEVRVADRGQDLPSSPSALASSCRSSGSGTRRRTAKASASGSAVAKGFVESMGGTVEVEDTPGGAAAGGFVSTARLRLAVVGENQVFPPRAPFFLSVGNLPVPHTPPRLRSRVGVWGAVLVVDDEPQLLRALGTNLKARGYTVDLDRRTGRQRVRGPHASTPTSSPPRPRPARTAWRWSKGFAAGSSSRSSSSPCARRSARRSTPSTRARTTTSRSVQEWGETLARIRARSPRLRGEEEAVVETDDFVPSTSQQSG